MDFINATLNRRLRIFTVWFNSYEVKELVKGINGRD